MVFVEELEDNLLEEEEEVEISVVEAEIDEAEGVRMEEVDIFVGEVVVEPMRVDYNSYIVVEAVNKSVVDNYVMDTDVEKAVVVVNNVVFVEIVVRLNFALNNL